MDQATQLRELAQRLGVGSVAAPPDPTPAARPRPPLTAVWVSSSGSPARSR
ncbi:MAG: hypothetical protein ACO3ZY_10455 [Phycisphaerales bacterium]